MKLLKRLTLMILVFTISGIANSQDENFLQRWTRKARESTGILDSFDKTAEGVNSANKKKNASKSTSAKPAKKRASKHLMFPSQRGKKTTQKYKNTVTGEVEIIEGLTRFDTRDVTNLPPISRGFFKPMTTKQMKTIAGINKKIKVLDISQKNISVDVQMPDGSTEKKSLKHIMVPSLIDIGGGRYMGVSAEYVSGTDFYRLSSKMYYHVEGKGRLFDNLMTTGKSVVDLGHTYNLLDSDNNSAKMIDLGSFADTHESRTAENPTIEGNNSSQGNSASGR